MKLVFDIETVAYEFNSLAASQKEYILRYSEKEKDQELKKQKADDSIRYLSLYPYTAKIISIGMKNIESGKTLVLFESSENEEWYVEEKNIKYIGMSEVEMIELFWKQIKKASLVITFNGKSFDIPFLMIRSSIHKITPARNLLRRGKAAHNCHIDLLNKFTFNNSIKKFNLDFYCHAFGIRSPKEDNITGMEVKELYSAGKIKEIAVYCGEDVRATTELYDIWEKYLKN